MAVEGVAAVLKVPVAEILTCYAVVCCLARAHQNHHEAY